jgi:cytochrome b pre-mRNA-processing protein 3
MPAGSGGRVVGTIASRAAPCQAEPNQSGRHILLFLKRLFQPQPMRGEGRRLYEALAAQARLPVFYADLGVPDSIDGRFEMLCVHAHAIFHRLRGRGAQADQLGQATYDAMFAGLDAALREMGVADLGVGRRIKIMTHALNGRIQAYDAALASADAGELPAALRRNAYGTASPQDAQVAALATYQRTLRASLAGADDASLLAGAVPFPQVNLHVAP